MCLKIWVDKDYWNTYVLEIQCIRQNNVYTILASWKVSIWYEDSKWVKKQLMLKEKLKWYVNITSSHLVRTLPGCASEKEANTIRYCHINRGECLKETTDTSRLYKIIFPHHILSCQKHILESFWWLFTDQCWECDVSSQHPSLSCHSPAGGLEVKKAC